jgi:glycosyltransferase involved in cell wall biosynthesis
MNEKYLYDFFDSLKNQTYKDFDIVVVNDGYEHFEKIKIKYSDLCFKELKCSNTPVKNREYGINYCIENDYDILIFGDSDDYFSINRVEKSLELLKDNDIVVNDLSLFDENGLYEDKYISNRIENNTIINLDFIKDKNIFGLSNTAIILKNIQKIILPKNIIAVDWYIFSLLLLDNKKAIFINEAISYYRQHQDNTVGMKDMDSESFKKAVEIKKKHYTSLSLLTNKFSKELDRLSNLQLDIKNQRMKNPLWWELI